MEANNMKAMREACQKMLDLLMLRGDGKARCVLTWDEFNESQLMLRAALAAPPRNCEIGTADEQQARHCAWCRKHGIDGDNTVNCLHPDLSCDLCALRWAQMPYKKGDGDGSK